MKYTLKTELSPVNTVENIFLGVYDKMIVENQKPMLVIVNREDLDFFHVTDVYGVQHRINKRFIRMITPVNVTKIIYHHNNSNIGDYTYRMRTYIYTHKIGSEIEHKIRHDGNDYKYTSEIDLQMYYYSDITPKEFIEAKKVNLI